MPVKDELVTDPADAMRTQIMEFQGLKYGKLTPKQKREEKRQRKKIGLRAKDVEDDYLFGPLSVESYVIFRVRPLIERWEAQAARLAFRLNFIEILGFIINSSGAVLATGFANASEWVALTVAIGAVLTAIVEFTQLRNQLVSLNLALRNLQSLLVWWDSLSVVKRRTGAIKALVVGTTERAIIQVVDAQTTAASNTQTSVANQLSDAGGADYAEG